MLLSIIIPVYNVEAFLPKCIESCLCQNIPTSLYEIIVVNDGSPDNSLEILRKYEKEQKNVIIVDKENGGLSSARNAGYRIAKGDYIWFVDSDDWIKKNCLKELVFQMRTTPDVISLCTIICKGSIEIEKCRPLLQGQVYSGDLIYKKSWFYPYSGVQFYLFQRNFLESNSLSFKEGVVFEDLLFTPQALSIAYNCAVYSEPIYYYRIRENSITSSQLSENKIKDLFSVMEAQYLWLQTKPECNVFLMSDVICKTANNIIRNIIFRISRGKRMKFVKELNGRKYWRNCVIDSKNLKNYIYFYGCKLLNIFS